MIVPIIRKKQPYIHFDMDDSGRICRVLQRREGDEMPETGNNDMGLFSMSFDVYKKLDTNFSSSSGLGDTTGERNFLPFIPWLSERENVALMIGTGEMETVGINTKEEASELEIWLCNRNIL